MSTEMQDGHPEERTDGACQSMKRNVVIYIHTKATRLPVMLPVAQPVAWPVTWPVVLPRCGLPLTANIYRRRRGEGGKKGCIRCHEQIQDDERLAVGADG
jgi:hypothetical protein